MPIFVLPGDWCPQKSEEPSHSTVGSSSPAGTQGKDDTSGCESQHLRSPELLPCLSLPIQATKTWQGHPRPHTGCWHCQGGPSPCGWPRVVGTYLGRPTCSTQPGEEAEAGHRPAGTKMRRFSHAGDEREAQGGFWVMIYPLH